MVSSEPQTQRDQGDEIFVAFKEWLRIQEARNAGVAQPHEYGSSHSRQQELHVSPGIAPVEPSMSVDPHQASFQRDGISRDRRSVGRRVFRTLTYGFIIIATVGAALAWQSSDDKTRDTIRAWGTSLSQLSSILATKSPVGSDAATEPASKASEQASVAATSSHDLQHQLETMVSDLAVTRHMVEQVAAKQEQMAQDIAALRSAQQNLSERTSSLPQSPTVSPGKNAQRIVHSEAPVQLPSVPIPTPRPQKPLPSH